MHRIIEHLVIACACVIISASSRTKDVDSFTIFQLNSELIEEGSLHWSLQVINSDELSISLKKTQNDDEELSTEALFLHSKGLQPFFYSSNDQKLTTINNKVKFNFSCSCWKAFRENVLGYLSNLDKFSINSDQIMKILSSQWFIINQVRVNYTNHTNSVGFGTSLTISKKLKNKHYYHPCRPFVSVFISQDSELYLTYNNFQTWIKVQVVSLIPVLHGKVHDFALTYHGILFLVTGKLYYSHYAENGVLDVALISSEDKVNGIAQTKICYRSQSFQLPQESYNLLIWSNNRVFRLLYSEKKKIYEEKIVLIGIKQRRQSVIHYLNFANHPDHFVFEQNLNNTNGTDTSDFFICELRAFDEATCDQMSDHNTHVANGGTFYVGSCPKLCGFIVSSKGLWFVYPSINVNKLVTKNLVLSVAYVNDMTLWIFVFESNWLLISSNAKFIKEYRLTEELKEYYPLLLSMDTVTLVKECSACSDIIIRRTSIYSILEKNGIVTIQPSFSQSELKHKNVFSLSDLSEQVRIQGFISNNMNVQHLVHVEYDLKNTKLLISTKTQQETLHQSFVRTSTLSFDINISIHCVKDNILKCGTGIAKLFIEFDPVTHENIYLPHTVFYINVTCPSNVRLLLGPKTTKGGCLKEENCTITIKENDLVHLSFELHKGDTKISDVIHDVVITELNNRTGFYINNQYVLGKECFLCDQFHIPTNPSQFVLQTYESACPCKKTMDNHGTWTGNITFLGAVSYTNNEDNFVFMAQVVDNSLCDHRSYFNLKIINAPPPTFQLWEYVMIAVFFGITLLSLAISYRNYIIFVKENKDKMSSTTLKPKGD